MSPVKKSPTVTTVEVTNQIKAAVIDDAFDEIQKGELTIDALKEFHQLGEVDDLLDNLLNDLKIEKPNIEDFDDADDPIIIGYINSLLENVPNNQQLEVLLRTLMSEKVDKVIGLHQICANLQSSNIQVEKFGSNLSDDQLSAFADGSFSFLFVDFFLGVDNTHDAIVQAQEVTKAIFRKCPQDKTPVTVLMSSKDNVEGLKDEFRSKANLQQRAFVFSHKVDLYDNQILTLKLLSYFALLNYSNTIQAYIKTFSNAAFQASKIFRKEISDLGIDDYAFIQHAGLLEEGHPLGDYMAWLFGSRWSSLLFNNKSFKKKLKVLDKLTIPTPLLLHDTPSDHIANIYVSSLFDEHINELAPHPLNPDNGLPYLTLGDIFSTDENSPVYMVINPQCDLERDMPLDRSVLLIPGRLISLEAHVVKGGTAKTDFFKFDESYYRINWLVKEVISVTYKDLAMWIEERGSKRTHRLKLQFAMEIQQIFASTIARVGLPIAPPFNKSVKVDVLFTKDKKEATSILESDDFAFSAKVKGKTKLLFKLDFGVKLKRALLDTLQSLETEKGTLLTSDPAAAKRLDPTIHQTKLFLADFDNWFSKNSTLDFPEGPKSLGTFASLFVDANLEKWDKYFTINLVTKVKESIL